MAPNVTPIERLQDRPIGVDPAAIEEEFTRIWQESAPGAGYDESSVRLRVLNFVAIGNAAEAAARFERVMEVVPRHHPCRGILALMFGARDSIEATISAHCVRAMADALEICSEEVLLSGGEGQQQELASAVLALLVPELPVVAWLIGRGDLGSYLSSEVLEASDAVLVDSGDGAPGPAIRAALEAEGEHDARIFDMAWGRTETWRELVAQFFDPGDRVAELRRVASIEIRGFRGRQSSEPMLLAGWLVSRLGYSLADLDGDSETIRATLYDGTRGVSLTVGPGWSPELMTALCITTENAEYEVQGHEVSHHLHVIERVRGEEFRRAVDAPPLDDASLILLGLDPRPDPAIATEAAVAALALLGE